MSTNGRFSIPCLPLTQPIGSFFAGVMRADDLISISFAAEQKMIHGETDSLIGIERPLSDERLKEIGRYVNNVDAAFPTSVLIAVTSKDAHYDESSQTMTFSRAKNVAEILDGQHRIAGLRQFSGDFFQLPVTIFVDMDVEDRAMVFATVNLKQTRVSKSMAYNLYEYATSRSPQKTAHDIAKLLNAKDGSPFEDKIKILGVTTEGKDSETLTQARFVEDLLALISSGPDDDRDRLKRRRSLKKADHREAKRLVFRNMFIEELDAQIARVLWNYFSAVRKKWPRAWDASETGLILNRTTGFSALMRLLRQIYVQLREADPVVSEAAFLHAIEPVSVRDDEFTPVNFNPGSSGQGALLRRFQKEIAL